jgi:hypothetical protein
VAATDIVALADAKAQLNITDTSSDAELAGYISAVTRPVEKYVGPVIHRNVTEVFDGGRTTMILSQIPVVSITSVTEGGTLVAASGYTVAKDSGVLTRVAGVAPVATVPGVQSVSVLYVAGQAADTTAVTANLGHIRLAALIILQHMWETQRPAGGGPFSQGQDDYDPRYSYSIPRRALELLGEPIGGFA